MTTNFAAAMRRAALSTRAYDPIEATRIIQDALAQQPGFLQSAADSKRPLSLRLIDPGAEIIPSSRTQYEPGQRKPLGDVLRIGGRVVDANRRRHAAVVDQPMILAH